ncbi:hypothetical protein LTR37_007837 [Vermiconidia calcicola]|uniref:Uncharacterized protein n=1 Tax=Vermiconidia calcicola TaxID=1690605 RepID=A0ACC3NDN8_9PEZI|nr:hypothetical protein LTR37_007837 [Vermiconidia calcicola]
MTAYQNISSTCHISKLPYELRQRIFRYTLRQNGTVEMQIPTWTDRESYTQPLFYVCRWLRGEALEAFYKVNTFVWAVARCGNTGVYLSSDPSKYPLDAGNWSTLTPALPWHYPRLLEDLRYLVLNFHVPSSGDAHAWSTVFPQQLQSVITALRSRRKLRELQITFLMSYPSHNPSLSSEKINILNTLSELRVSATVNRPLQSKHWICRQRFEQGHHPTSTWLRKTRNDDSYTAWKNIARNRALPPAKDLSVFEAGVVDIYDNPNKHFYLAFWWTPQLRRYASPPSSPAM